MSFRDERDRLFAGAIGLAAFLAVACFAASTASFGLQVDGVGLAVTAAMAAIIVLVHELMLWRFTLPQMVRTLPARSVDAASLAHGIFPAALGLALSFISARWWIGPPFVFASFVTLLLLWKRNTGA